MRTTKLLLCLAFAGVTFAMSPAASAKGVAISVGDLNAKDRVALVQGIEQAKTKHQKLFAKVADARKLAIEVDENKRGRGATITQSLKALGKDALYPMLEMLAVQAPARGTMSESAWRTLRVGLLEAVAALRDDRAKPVLFGILAKETDYDVLRAATEALGRLGDDATSKRLVTFAKKAGDKQLAVWAGLGECRRAIAAKELARASTSADPATLLVVIRSLSDVGNSWAWQTPHVRTWAAEEDEVRGTAAVALVNLFVKHDGLVRERAGKALLVVDHPSTLPLLQVARQQQGARTVAAIDELAARFAKNPVR